MIHYDAIAGDELVKSLTKAMKTCQNSQYVTTQVSHCLIDSNSGNHGVVIHDSSWKNANIGGIMLSPCSGHTLDTIGSEKIACYSSQHDLAHGRITTKLENFGKYGFRQTSKLILELKIGKYREIAEVKLAAGLPVTCRRMVYIIPLDP